MYLYQFNFHFNDSIFFNSVQVKQQNSTSAKVAQMFDLVFDPKTDKEQRLQVHIYISIYNCVLIGLVCTEKLTGTSFDC